MPDDTSILHTDARVRRLVEEARAEGLRAGIEAAARECADQSASRTDKAAELRERGRWEAADYADHAAEILKGCEQKILALAPEPPAPAPEKPHE